MQLQQDLYIGRRTLALIGIGLSMWRCKGKIIKVERLLAVVLAYGYNEFV
jgi:hypothetical protein